MIGRWLTVWMTGTAQTSSVLRVMVPNVRMPRSQRRPCPLPGTRARVGGRPRLEGAARQDRGPGRLDAARHLEEPYLALDGARSRHDDHVVAAHVEVADLHDAALLAVLAARLLVRHREGPQL